MTVTLLERCQRGDEAAWRELFAAYAAHVYRWAVLLGLSPTEAEDAAQDVLATAARRIRTCEADRALSSWFFQITRRVVANHRRKRWLRRWLPSRAADVDDRAGDQHQAFHFREDWAREHELETRRCLRRLPRELAEVLVMVEVVGMTRIEAARVLGIPPGTVASRVRRARAVFLECWHDDGTAMAATPLEESP
jgi:RNA polymerase sigma-70 factor (ECF subfamily)